MDYWIKPHKRNYLRDEVDKRQANDCAWLADHEHVMEFEVVRFDTLPRFEVLG
jgi:hypothetical protein